MGELCPGSKRWEEREWLIGQPEDWWRDVFDRIAGGEPYTDVVRGYCIRPHMFRRVLKEQPERKAEFVEALEIAGDTLAFETIAIMRAADPETVSVAKAQSDNNHRIAKALNRPLWGEVVKVEKTVSVEVNAGLAGYARELLLKMRPKEQERVVATIDAPKALEAEAPEEAVAATPAGKLPPRTAPGQPVWDI